MSEAKCDETSRKHTIIKFLGIAALMLLILVNLANSTPTSDAWNKEGDDRFNAGNYNGALEAYNNAIGNDPQNSYVWYGIGNALRQLGMYNEAIKAFDKAIEINPQNPQNSVTWNTKGVVLADYFHDQRAALAAFTTATDLDPNNSIARDNRIRAFHEVYK